MRIQLPPLTVDLSTGTVRGEGVDTTLRPQELRLLRWLAERPGRTWGRDTLLSEVWGYGPRVVSRTLDTTLSRLRAKIELDTSRPRYLLTVPGEGLRLELPPTLASEGVGRGDDLARLEAALAASPLVTVCGLGGVGKTYLVRQLRRGVFCEAADATTSAELVQAIARELGAELLSPDPSALVELLDLERPGLLVIDNVEQVLDAARGLVPVLLDAKVRVLVTSRQPLGLSGERRVQLEGLDLGSAEALYVLRGGQPQPGLSRALDAVDRLPLAIELLAAWHGVLPLEALQSRLDLLVDDSPEAPDRQRSLTRVLDDTVASLPRREAQALRAFAVLPTPFGLAEAECVAGPTAALAVRGLLRRALLRPEGESSWSMLQSVRAWLRSDIPREVWAGLARATAEGHVRPGAADLLRAARSTTGPDAAACARLLARQPEADVQATLQRLLELGMPGEAARLLHRAGRFEEALQHLESPDGVEGLVLRAAVSRDLGRVLEAMEDLDRALELSECRGRPLAEKAALLSRVGRTDEARSLAQEAVRVLRRGDDRATLAYALRVLAGLERETGQWLHLEEALELVRELGDVRTEGIVLGATAIQWLDEGDLDRARSAVQAAIDQLRRCGAGHLAAVYLANRALIERVSGASKAARATSTEALRLLRRHGDRVHEALALGGLGELDLDEGRDRQALARLEEARGLAREARFAKLEALFQALAGEARVRLGSVVEGLQAQEAATQTLRKAGFQDALCKVLSTRARTALDRGRPEEARAFVEQARALKLGIAWVDRAWQEVEDRL